MDKDEEIIYSRNTSINQAITRILPCFSDTSQVRMRRAIRSAKRAVEKHRTEDTDAGARHIFREFLPAYELNKCGFAFEYEQEIQGLKPDWIDRTASMVFECYTYERGGSSDFWSRVNAAVSKKCNKYKGLITSESHRMVVGVYIDFCTFQTVDECRENLAEIRSIFASNQMLSAIVFYQESMVVNGIQQYEYFCVCSDDFFESFSSWQFPTESLSS